MFNLFFVLMVASFVCSYHPLPHRVQCSIASVLVEVDGVRGLSNPTIRPLMHSIKTEHNTQMQVLSLTSCTSRLLHSFPLAISSQRHRHNYHHQSFKIINVTTNLSTPPPTSHNQLPHHYLNHQRSHHHN